MRRNEAGQVVTAQLNALADGTPVTSGTTTVTVVKDGIGATGTGTIAHVNGGLWKYLPTQTETDARHLAFVFTNVLAGTQTPQMYTEVNVNLLKMNGNVLPVTNLELQYDTTGLVGDTFPASQAQVGTLSTGSGGISTVSTGVVITDGNELGLYTDTFALDSNYHSFTPAVGSIDFYYESEIGEAAIATSVLWEGYAQSNGDTINVFAWNWVGSTWVQVDTLIGVTALSPVAETFVLTNNMTGATGADTGKIRLRFQSTTATTFATDRILFEYTAVAENAFVLHSGTAQAGSNNSITLDINSSVNDGSYINSRVITTNGTGAEQENIITDYNGTTKVAIVKSTWIVNPDNTTGFNITPAQVHTATQAGGYEGGKVYINIAEGAAGTLRGVNGTSSNPSSVLADARAIADLETIRIFDIKGSTGFSLDQGYDFWVFEVTGGLFVDLNLNSVSGSVFNKMGVTGTGTSASRCVFELCGLVNLSIGVANFLECGFNGEITLSATDVYTAHKCFEFASITAPIINIAGDNVTTTTLELVGYDGRLVLKNMTSVDLVVISGDAQVTLDSTCIGGTVHCAGDVKITDNSTISPTFITGLTKDIDNATKDILVDTGTDIPALISNVETKVDAVLVDTGTDIPATLLSMSGATFNTATDSLEAIRNRGDVEWTTATGFSTFNPALDVVAKVTLVDTTTDLTNNTDLTPVLNNQTTINSNVLSRLATVGYTAPNNAGIASIETKVDGILVDTGTSIPDLINALENLSAAAVKAELVAVLSGDVTVEPTSIPSATAPISDKLGYLFAFAANKLNQTASLQSLRNTGDTADISTAPITTNGVTTTRGKHT